jgi:hypothetical protein
MNGAEDSKGTLISALSVSGECLTLLTQANEATDRLISAVDSTDIETLEAMLELRGNLYAQVAACIGKLNQSVNLINDACSVKTDLQRLQTVLKQLMDESNSLMKKQSRCETLLENRLQEYRSELIEFRQQQNQYNAYHPTSTNQAPIFLDNRY